MNEIYASAVFPLIGPFRDSLSNFSLSATQNQRLGTIFLRKKNHVVPDGNVTTLAGGQKGFSDRTGSQARFNHPYGVAVDKQNNVYVADSYNNRIRKITPGGQVTTVAGNGNDGFLDGPQLQAEFYVPIAIFFSEEIFVIYKYTRQVFYGGQLEFLIPSGTPSFCTRSIEKPI